jgi:hypothetical protein
MSMRSAIAHCLLAAVASIVCLPRSARACVGTDCMEIWSTAANGGALTVYWDFAHKVVQTFPFCLNGQCLDSTIDPGFITTEPAPDGSFYSLADGTNVTIEIVAIDSAATLQVNGVALAKPGDAALLGTAPTLHTHPSWQLSLPEGTLGNYSLSYKLTTDSPLYSESAVYAVTLTNLPTPTPSAPTPSATPTATPTQSAPACPGDCNGDGKVTVDELVRAVSGALGTGTACSADDLDGDGTISITELVAAVNAALNGCPATPTPTASMRPTATFPPTLDNIQRTIFSPRCAIPTCHDAAEKAGNLNLSAGSAYDQLVGVPPTVDTARAAGFLRVDPGKPENSFLIVKLDGPPPGEGSRMPLTGTLLTDAEVQLISDWIAQGASD